MTVYDATEIPVRADLADAIERAWDRLARPGTWWSGEERVAIAAETRQAMACPLCRARKAALSPQHAEGSHTSLGRLSAAAVDAIHRIRTDASRLSEGWLQALQAEGLKDVEYVEIVGVVAVVSAVDTFDRAMGLEQRALPVPVAGAASRRRPRGAKPGLGWLDTLAPEDLSDGDPDPFTRFGAYNIQRALSLVPEEVITFFELDAVLYFYEWGCPERAAQIEARALSEAQIELVAARSAALNGCLY